MIIANHIKLPRRYIVTTPNYFNKKKKEKKNRIEHTKYRSRKQVEILTIKYITFPTARR